MAAPLLIDYHWHHAVNDQSKLNRALDYAASKVGESGGGAVEALEADIIYSEAKQQAVMGHPPSIDGDLTLASFLQQIHQAGLQQGCDSDKQGACPVLKLDFKSMPALRSSLADVTRYLNNLPKHLHRRVWINADILPGPGEDLDDVVAQRKVQSNFDAAEFLQLVTGQLPGTVLSIGWNTSLTKERAVYTNNMVDEMVRHATPNSDVTFPVRASCFRASWPSLRKLYDANCSWTVTIWWSRGELPKEEFDWMYETLELDEKYRNRTFYDVLGS
ncbi:hypothetical protein ACHAXT_009276 [Thalassiosira profunda]